MLAIGAGVAATYVAAAQLGFRAAFVAEQVTTVWAPTGIALASLLMWGPRLWPAIWLGAFAVNATTSAPLWTAVVVASGNTLEAVVATWMLRRIPLFDFSFRRVADVLTFVGVAAVACTTVSATVGTATLCAAGVQSWQRFGVVWFNWWLGDALGALVVAPAVLTIGAAPRWGAKDRTRLAVFVSAAVLVTHLAFSDAIGLGAHPLEYVVFPVAIAAAVTGGPPTTSLVVLASSAVAIWNTVRGSGPFTGSEMHYNLILLQGFTGVLAGTALLLSAAIAERKLTELRERNSADTLRRREEMLRLAQRAGGVASFEWDFQKQVANCSAEFFAIFGLPPHDGVMEGAHWAQFVHPDDRDRMATHLARALEGTEPAAADYRVIRSDGNVRWLTYAGQLQATPDGTRMLGTVADITDRKRSEAALKEAKEAAESANQLKDQFLATLSHELRTPLNAILGYARMLQTNSIPSEKRSRAIDIIERNAVAQNQLIEDLLDISRITRGQVRLEPTPIPIAPILRETVEGVRPAAEAKSIALDVSIDPFAGTVAADSARLQQVFWNLLTNAVKFTQAGGRVTASVRRSGDHVELSVRDTGTGISAEFLPFVFEPFRQGDARLARGQGGLGLGLAISKQLVELHGGTIHAGSEGVGRGATFVVRLPRHSDSDAVTSVGPIGDRAHRPLSTIPGAAPLDGIDILLVDDEEDTLTMLREALENAGARVRGVRTARDAIRENSERTPDLLVTDIGLPEMDGLELLREIRRTHPTVTAVAVTAYARLDDRSRALAGGFHAHVSKPIDPAAFVQALVAAVSQTE
jgi:PAS domain S-box-containing protein